MRVEPFSVPLAEPLETAGGTIERREGFLVRTEGDGAEGVGEATPLPGWTESLDDCERALRAAVDAFQADDDSAALAAVADAPAAGHGLRLSIADHGARASGRPLYRHLGADRHVESVPVNATVGDGRVEATVAAAERAAAEGFRTIKCKVGARPVDSDLERIRAVRGALDDGVALRVDANGAWSRGAAERAVDGLADLAVEYVEQPVAAGDLDGMAGLRGSTVGVAADEAVAEHGVNAVLDAGAADVVVLKPMAMGGPRRTLEAAASAATRGVATVVTTTVDAAVARTAACHVAAAIPDVRACGLATGGRLGADLADDPAPIDDGSMRVPQSPGHGVDEVDRDDWSVDRDA